MPLSGTAAYGIYPGNVALPDVVCTLNRAGFRNEDICVVLSPAHPVAAVMRDARIFNAGRDASAASAATIGWFSKLGAVVIPTVGFFIRSQEFFRALVIEQDFGGLCGESRALAGLGFSRAEATRLSRQLDDCGALICVSCRESAAPEAITELLRYAGAPEAARLDRADASVVSDSVRNSKPQKRLPFASPASYTPEEISALAS